MHCVRSIAALSFVFLLTATTKAEKRARVNRVEKESLWSYRSPSLDKEWLRKHELSPVDFDAMCPVNRGAVFSFFLLTATTKAENVRE